MIIPSFLINKWIIFFSKSANIWVNDAKQER